MVGGIKRKLGARPELVALEVDEKRMLLSLHRMDHHRMTQMSLACDTEPVTRVMSLDIGVDQCLRPALRLEPAS